MSSGIRKENESVTGHKWKRCRYDGQIVRATLKREEEAHAENEALIPALAVTAHASLSPVSAIVGGVWGRELVKVDVLEKMHLRHSLAKH